MLASALAAGIVFGWLLRGDLRRLATLEVKWWALLLVGVALRLVAEFIRADAALLVVAFSSIAVVALRNVRRVPGSAFLAAGALMNGLVVAANGGMPVDRGALAIAAASPTPGLHVELTDQTMFPLLADVIPVRLTHVVYSAGDLVLAVGGFLVPFRWVRHE